MDKAYRDYREQMFVKLKGARITADEIKDKFNIRPNDIFISTTGNIIIFLDDYGEIRR